MEEKIKNLSRTIVNYSLALKENEKVLIMYQSTEERDLVMELIKEANRVGAICFTNFIDPIVSNYLTETTTEKRISLIRKYQEFEVDNFDAFIQICYRVNDFEGKNIKSSTTKAIGDACKKARDIRINHRKWVLLNYPSIIDAYKAKMTIHEFKEFAFNVMNVDYQEMSRKIKPLKELMEKTDKVRITSPNGTDITFSIKGIPAIPCVGNMNIPDGEIYTAPVKNSVNGKIVYNTPSPYQGKIYEDVSLTFENGKIVKAECSESKDNERLNEIFNIDDGARYVGEFSFGLNPKILYPMGDILYDEKILGSIHFTPGSAYQDAYNGNDSSVHWDMVLIQRKDYGGGEIYFDDVLIRKDGEFVLEELKELNS